MTLAILAGRKGSYVIFLLLLFVPFVTFAVLAVYSSYWFVFPLLTLLTALKLEPQFRHGELAKMPQKVAGLNFKLTIAYVAAFAFAESSALPCLT